MKNAFLCFLIIIAVLSSCKDETCFDCSQVCKKCTVYDNYYGPVIYENTFCGTQVAADAYVTGIQAAYSGSGDFVSCGGVTGNSQEVCGEGNEVDALVDDLEDLGYNCTLK